MKTYLLAAALAAVPMSADAAVVINFSGTTFAPAGGGTGGSYTQAFDGSTSSYAVNAAQSVSGTITIDTAAAGANQGGSGVYYDGNGGSFLTVAFNGGAANPVQLTGQQTAQYVDDGSIAFNLFNADGSYAYSFSLYSNDPVPTASYGGTLLPNFAGAQSLFFTVSSQQGDAAGPYTRIVSEGSIGALTQVTTGTAPAVPEPASWAMMIAGLGVVGSAARRRRGRVAAVA